jgi:hypothetical protein
MCAALARGHGVVHTFLSSCFFQVSELFHFGQFVGWNCVRENRLNNEFFLSNELNNMFLVIGYIKWCGCNTGHIGDIIGIAIFWIYR